MAARPQDQQFEEARRVRAELRLALTQADELMRRAEAVLLRSSSAGPATIQECNDQTNSPALFGGGL